MMCVDLQSPASRHQPHSPVCEPVSEPVTAKRGQTYPAEAVYWATCYQDSTFTQHTKSSNGCSHFLKRVEGVRTGLLEEAHRRQGSGVSRQYG